jgi:hypothetical protein
VSRPGFGFDPSVTAGAETSQQAPPVGHGTQKPIRSLPR